MLEIIATSDDLSEARGWALLLSAVTMPHRVVDRTEEPLPFEEDEVHERFCLIVSDEDADRARALIDVHREEEESRKATAASAQAAVMRSTKANGVIAALLLSTFFFLIYARTPGFDSPLSRLLRVDAERVFDGQWYRLIGAAFLHGDAGHLFSNIGFLVPLGMFCVERLGVGHFLFAFVWTATLGDLASVFWHGMPFISLGASGGVFGLFGLLVGSSLAEARARQRKRELLAAGLAFLAMTAFAPKSDMAAHVFGFVAGLAFGAMTIRFKQRSWLDVVYGLLAMLTTMVVFGQVL